jgi:hypothetical protein
MSMATYHLVMEVYRWSILWQYTALLPQEQQQTYGEYFRQNRLTLFTAMGSIKHLAKRNN